MRDSSLLSDDSMMRQEVKTQNGACLHILCVEYVGSFKLLSYRISAVRCTREIMTSALTKQHVM